MKPIVLCILDGVGIRDETDGNAVKLARMPNFNFLWNHFPHSLLEASGMLVGLPDGQMGNSEVGHMNIGAGRIICQPLEFINKSIQNKEFYQNEEFLNVIKHVKKRNSKLHLLGLLSDGGIHSHMNHLFALIDLCQKEKVEKVYLHLFLDGRDTLPDVSITYLHQLEEKIKNLPHFHIATISGRYYAMDRDNRWDRIEKTYQVMTEGNHIINDIDMYIKKSYGNDIYDEFIIPATVNSGGMIENHDGLIAFNYRPDRLRELFKVITNENFHEFEKTNLIDLKTVTMMSVSDEVKSTPAFHLQDTPNLLGQIISEKGLKQLRIAETEKYAHVTYFFDGGRELKLKGEDRILIPSPHVPNYELTPGMSAEEITDTLIKELEKDLYSIVILNYANGDMIGHTGNLDATIHSLEILDTCLGKLYQEIRNKDGILIVTADHGNSDQMIDKNDHRITSHSLSKVPFIITKAGISLRDGKLGDIAPTILHLLQIPIPPDMTGNRLFDKKQLKQKNNSKKE